MSKNIKSLIFITFGLFILIFIGIRNEAFQPIITKLVIASLILIIIKNIYVGINLYMKKNNNRKNEK